MNKSIKLWAELVFALNIWALSFVASRSALSDFKPFTLATLRFWLVIIVGLPLLLRLRLPLKSHVTLFRTSFVAGICLGFGLLLQFLGLLRSSVSNVSFITTLYVVFVPILEWRQGKKPHPILIVAVVFALIGSLLMCRIFESQFNVGDLFTLGCALLSAIHILVITRVGQKNISSLGFNLYQSFWAGLFTLPFGLLLENFETIHAKAWGALLFLVIFVNLIAFTIQIRVQRVFSSTTISLIYLIEAPLAAWFAYIFLNETMTPSQIAGGALILFSSALAVAFNQSA